MAACVPDDAPEIGSAAYYADPYPAFAARRVASRYHTVPGVDGDVGVYGYHDAVALLSNAAVKSTRLRTFFPVPDPDLAEFQSLHHWVSASVLHSEDAHHRRLRDVLERPLSAIPVQRYEAGRSQEARLAHSATQTLAFNAAALDERRRTGQQ